MEQVMRHLRGEEKNQNVELLLTDLYPNKDLIDHYDEEATSNITYHPHAVDARDFSKIPKGLKTMSNIFHHMKPEDGRHILASASQHKEPLLIYEMAENKIPTLIWAIFLPLGLAILFIMSWFMTPFTKPSLKQLLFTYLIPLIPIFYAWDGQVSMIRMYTFGDFEQLLDGLEVEGYQWEMGQALKEDGKAQGYYVFGRPVEKA